MEDWTELRVTVPQADAATATDIAAMVADGGLYIEDYSDLEQQVMAMAHVDLIEEALRAAPKDRVTLHLYVSPGQDAVGAAAALAQKLDAAGVRYTLESAGVRQQDWETAWKQYYHPMEIGRRLAVAPSWEPYTGAGRVVLQLDPGMAFGTGAHETTALCLEVLDAMVQGGERVLDIGTGSGILAVAALLLGAGEALGVDIDAMAVRTATENAQRNGVAGRFTAVAGDLAAKATGRYHIITANIVADAIIRLAPTIPPLLAPGGSFIASGIIGERQAQVAAALESCGLNVAEVLDRRGWVALVCKGRSA